MMVNNEQKELISKLKEKIKHFDLISLIRLLEFKNIPLHSLLFQSNDSIVSQDKLLQNIYITDKGMITIELNIGLLSVQSPLPSNMIRHRNALEIDSKAFNGFIRYFDHIIIKQLIVNLYPDLNEHYFIDYNRYQYDFIRSLHLRTVKIMDVIVRYCFPEFKIRVTKQLNCTTYIPVIHKMGTTELKDVNDCHKSPSIPSGLKIIIEIPDFHSKESWPQIIKARLKKYFFPLLSCLSIYLEIYIDKIEHIAPLTLSKESSIGYEYLGAFKKSNQSKIFSGMV